MALGRLFTIAANFTDPDAYFVGGGVVEAAPHFRDWFLAEVREHTAAARGAGGGRHVRAGPGPRHGRRPRRGDRGRRQPVAHACSTGAGARATSLADLGEDALVVALPAAPAAVGEAQLDVHVGRTGRAGSCRPR